MLLTPSQDIIAADTHRFRVLNCGRRFGKTTLAIEEMKGMALYKKARIAYIAPTFQQARDIAWEALKSALHPIIKKVNESRLELTIHNINGLDSLIVLKGWEAIETLRGQQYDFLILDEVANMRNFWAGWHEVLSPTLVDTGGSALFISTPKGFNHFYDLYNLELKSTDFKSFHFTTYDNPHIPRSEIEREKQMKPEDAFAQEYLADFRKTEGLVYKEFDRARHIYEDEPRKIIEYIAGIDFGFNHPCAVIHVKRDADARFFVSAEWYKTRRTEVQVAEYVASCKFNRVYPDPENPSAIEVLNQRGIPVMEVIKGKGSVQTGINKVRELFKQNRLFIHKSCSNLINELETYSYKDRDGAQFEPENPIKEHDDALDALRYVITGTFELNVRPQEEEDAERLLSRLRNMRPKA